MFKFTPSFVFIPSDLTPEAKLFIEKHQAKRSGKYIWYKELGKDLLNYLERPDFIYEVLRQVASIYLSYMFLANVELVEGLIEFQIQNLLKTKQGNLLVDNIQGWLSPTLNSNSFSVERSKLMQLYMKIERIRVPIIVNDKRPYMGEMVGTEEDLGIDPSIAPGRAEYSFRFGGGHDGEHWLTKTIGAQVKATPGIKGIVLTYYYQGDGLWNVMILLDNMQTVFLIKDLVTLGPKIKLAPLTTKDNDKTPRKDESKFTDANKNPTSKIRLNAGDLIGTTMPWKLGSASVFYSGYPAQVVTFHFAFIKYEFVQNYRSKATGGGGVADDEVRNKMTEKEKQSTPALNWYIAPLSPASPVRCFK